MTITDAELLALSLASEALSEIDATVRAAHIGTAWGLVLSRFRERFEVDASTEWTVGDDTKRAIAALAAESLLGRRGYDPRAGGGADPITLAANTAREWLALVVSRKVRPLGTDAFVELGGPLVASTSSSAWSSWRRPLRCT